MNLQYEHTEKEGFNESFYYIPIQLLSTNMDVT